MEKLDEIKISSIVGEVDEIVKNAQDGLKQVGYDFSKVSNQSTSELKPISLVFAGQYSAGKSSIIKMLTGISDIAIGAGITTQEAHEYSWNGFRIIDTPGIHTTLRPDHDEKSYEEIKNADLLIYVVTQQLFDDNIGTNFRKLLIDQDKAGEMMLVVNKMATIGNTEKNQRIKMNDLVKVTTPYSPKDLRTVFIDAKSYIDSKQETDDEITFLLYERSNYEGIVEEINSFIQEKGISSRLTTPLYKVLDDINQAIKGNKESTGDSDVDAFEEQLYQKRRIISDSKRMIENTVNSIVEKSASEIRAKGRDIANTIYDYSNEDEANEAVQKAYDDVNCIYDQCVDKVSYAITENNGRLSNELDEFYNRDFSTQLQFRLEEKNAAGNPFVKRIFKSDIFTQVGQKVIENTVGEAGANGLKVFSGSNVHEWVLNIGHHFGKSFKPWEAVKWTKGINFAGKAVGIFGVALSVGMQAKEDVDSDNREKEMRVSREKLRAGFNDVASEVKNHFLTMLSEYIEKYYLPEIRDIDTQISSINESRQQKSAEFEMLEKNASAIKLEISKIHSL